MPEFRWRQLHIRPRWHTDPAPPLSAIFNFQRPYIFQRPSIVAAGNQFLFWLLAANESSDIYLSLAGYVRLPPRIGVRYPPTGRRAISTMFPPFHTCKFRCSPSGLQPAVFASWSVTHLTPRFHKHDACVYSNRFEYLSSVD